MIWLWYDMVMIWFGSMIWDSNCMLWSGMVWYGMGIVML